jgi:predicted ribonuclease YlaK
MDKTPFYDTCALLNMGASAFNTEFVIAQKTLEELENIKVSKSKDADIKARAAEVTRLLDENFGSYTVMYYGESGKEATMQYIDMLSPDTEIVTCAKVYQEKTGEKIVFVSDDISCKNLARSIFELDVCGSEELSGRHKCEYKGYIEVELDDEERAKFYGSLTENIYGLLVNQYIIIKDTEDNILDALKWTGEGYETIREVPFVASGVNDYFRKVKPKDKIQACAMDSITNNDITVLYGKAGTGKTTLPLAYAMQMLEKHKYKKIYVVYSYEPLKGAKTLGYEKGDHITKLLYSASIGNILASKFGDITAIEYMIANGSLEIIPTANIRGVEFQDSVVFVTEAQNLDTYTLKTIIQRCKSDCKQIYEGDIIEQKDKSLPDVGMNRLIEVFKGHPSFGCVKLKNNYRSPISELADKM